MPQPSPVTTRSYGNNNMIPSTPSTVVTPVMMTLFNHAQVYSGVNIDSNIETNREFDSEPNSEINRESKSDSNSIF